MTTYYIKRTEIYVIEARNEDEAVGIMYDGETDPTKEFTKVQTIPPKELHEI